METYGGLNIGVDFEKKEFMYGTDCFGPEVEKRHIDDIRHSLRVFDSQGPDIVYTIAMDIGKKEHRFALKKANLLYGACIYSKGRIGQEPVRSQGHIHAVSLSCNASTPEVYEIWFGEAYVLMQATAKPDVGKAYAVHGKVGDIIIVPPGYAHCTINARQDIEMVFGAWCIRDYGFDYTDVRKQKGLMYFPVFNETGQVEFELNSNYQAGELVIKEPRIYHEFGLDKAQKIYPTYEMNPNKFDFVTDPKKYKKVWENFEP